MQAMLVYPDLARSHMSFILDNLQDSQIFVLQVGFKLCLWHKYVNSI